MELDQCFCGVLLFCQHGIHSGQIILTFLHFRFGQRIFSYKRTQSVIAEGAKINRRLMAQCYETIRQILGDWRKKTACPAHPIKFYDAPSKVSFCLAERRQISYDRRRRCAGVTREVLKLSIQEALVTMFRQILLIQEKRLSFSRGKWQAPDGLKFHILFLLAVGLLAFLFFPLLHALDVPA